ncbi:MAG: type II toxin-antitoxin system VapC family toxin [Gemmatimonadetes bacterium]|nr:type II toxin-antitoxin system VapC family toxin [Gemmatimonadota bacterium]MCY3677238.1 type II toxin-antitoxin system VapC family toxin [Gemmatimonadota bacterium]MYA44716.1 type II toxin-antitoxin system VapC family toxin [Gemmatimonadota bacterium]MYE92143.1 type II toxin-antitoxin system VapC family toxin [Gemmatimonadota bacterium]MYJ12554.1 type II toxin-antitoxin system VapC family toxin [Gemmatimonadota bacterium]
MLLDTNVVSELVRKSPNPAVVSWVSVHPLEDLFLSAVGEAELRYGAAILPAGRRRDRLLLQIEGMLREAFADRVLPFDSDAARAYANIAARRRAAGRHVAVADCQIAAIAASRGMAVATRNVRDFEDMGIEIVDPWAGE